MADKSTSRVSDQPKTHSGTIGNNVSYERNGDELVIRVDLAKEFGLSASGKTISIASTQGNKAVANRDGQQIIMGLNVYRYAQEK